MDEELRYDGMLPVALSPSYFLEPANTTTTINAMILQN